jgi:hypothetical protein
MKCFEMIGRREKEYLKPFCNQPKLVEPVPPLRGLVTLVMLVPPLPQWATLFRPWRDSAVMR